MNRHDFLIKYEKDLREGTISEDSSVIVPSSPISSPKMFDSGHIVEIKKSKGKIEKLAIVKPIRSKKLSVRCSSISLRPLPRNELIELKCPDKNPSKYGDKMFLFMLPRLKLTFSIIECEFSSNTQCVKDLFPNLSFVSYQKSPRPIKIVILSHQDLSNIYKKSKDALRDESQRDKTEDFEIILNESSISYVDSLFEGEKGKEDEEAGKEKESCEKSILKVITSDLFQSLEQSFVEDILVTCNNIALTQDNFTKDSLLSILLPHILPWMMKYPNNKFFLLWINILKNITLYEDYVPHIDRSSQVFSALRKNKSTFFLHVLSVLKNPTDSTTGKALISCLCFFANLSSIPSQAKKVRKNIKDDLLGSWFEMVKQKSKEDISGVRHWCRLVSMLYPGCSSHNFDEQMEWCKANGCQPEDYSKYFMWSKEKIKEFSKEIKKCANPETTSDLYKQHREDILFTFNSFKLKSEIKEQKERLKICVQCLRWFIRHFFSQEKIFLPIPDLNDLIDTFIDHLSRVEKVLEGDVDEEYCTICMCYTFKVKDKRDSFLPKISPSFHRILERGSKKKFGGDVTQHLLITLRNISNSPSSSTRSSILTLIKPYIKDWLRIYNSSKCYGHWMYILSKITLSNDETPNKSLCSEAWPLFHPVLDVVKIKFVGDKIVEDDHEYVLKFFSNLCCHPLLAVEISCYPSAAQEIYDKVKDLLDKWFTVFKKKKHKWGIKYWTKLISMFSTVPSLVPLISPKFDEDMQWCKENGCWDEVYSKYIENCNTELSE
ncbi:hypothetical protein ADUPG1_006579 [Aduncisulcus paluster]|uniref:Uncharacterized protein n=1 Tax=Aduncisulcus paluster TaxID=2918883 RepID=A0ABQ5KIQ4_9EUKA|nr:hypothetical protein ADUPG1_006579 [Aduncisulcus paluster]